MSTNIRIGHGYDVHRLVTDRPLILGGVLIPHTHGLLGHSDADVLTHAILDALLGAMGQGDIGRHFPDSDERYRGISSLLLAKEVAALLTKSGFTVVNIDATVVAQKPKLAPHLAEMKINLADALSIDPTCLNIKATTEEGLGFTGVGEGIAAHAVCLITR